MKKFAPVQKIVIASLTLTLVSVLLIGSRGAHATNRQAQATAGFSGAPLTAKHREVSIVGQGEEIYFLFEARPSSVNVIQLLKSAVASGDISESEAEQIFIELSELTGARYKLPETRREIMASLGFPEGTVMLATNWFEMAAVHLETNLSTSALTSRFVLHALGVKSVVADSTASAGVEAEAAKAVAEINAATMAPVTVPAVVEPAVSERIEPAVSAVDLQVDAPVGATVKPPVSIIAQPQAEVPVIVATDEILLPSKSMEESRSSSAPVAEITARDSAPQVEPRVETREVIREISERSDPVVIEADRNPLALEAAPESRNFMPKPTLK